MRIIKKSIYPNERLLRYRYQKFQFILFSLTNQSISLNLRIEYNYFMSIQVTKINLV